MATVTVGRILDNGQGHFQWHTNMSFESFVRRLDSDIISPKFNFAESEWEFMLGKCEQGKLHLWLENVLASPYPKLNVTLGIFPKGDVPKVSSGETRPTGYFGVNWDTQFLDLLTKWLIVREELLIADGQLQLCDDSAVVTPTGEKVKGDTRNEESEDAKNLRLYLNLHTLSDCLEYSFVNGDNSDVTLIVKGKKFRVHSPLLRARSSVFSSMMTQELIGKNNGVVKIEDCTPGSFKELLRFLYTGKIGRLTKDSAVHLYSAADKYSVADLKLECVEFMKRSLSPEVVCEVIAFAKLHSEQELFSCVTEYFTKNVEKVLKTAEWQNFLKEYPAEGNELYIKALKTVRK